MKHQQFNSALVVAARPSRRTARSRHFRFTYATVIQGLRAGERARIWLPVARDTANQRVRIQRKNVPPGAVINTAKPFGNRILYCAPRANAAGKIALSITYDVRRKEVLTWGDPAPANVPAPARDLAANRRIPIGGAPLRLLKGLAIPRDPLARARFLYNLVDRDMAYSKAKPGWGHGDAVWACHSHFGNCTDFHSLFIALARSEHIPAKFVIGFLLPSKRGHGPVEGYHCWAWCKPGPRGWLPVDIAQASLHPRLKAYYFGDLTENRVRFSKGRDIALVPRQKGRPLNYFIYPYVEINGRRLSAGHIVDHFSFRDVQGVGRPRPTVSPHRPSASRLGTSAGAGHQRAATCVAFRSVEEHGL